MKSCIITRNDLFGTRRYENAAVWDGSKRNRAVNAVLFRICRKRIVRVPILEDAPGSAFSAGLTKWKTGWNNMRSTDFVWQGQICCAGENEQNLLLCASFARRMENPLGLNLFFCCAITMRTDKDRRKLWEETVTKTVQKILPRQSRRFGIHTGQKQPLPAHIAPTLRFLRLLYRISCRISTHQSKKASLANRRRMRYTIIVVYYYNSIIVMLSPGRRGEL